MKTIQEWLNRPTTVLQSQPFFGYTPKATITKGGTNLNLQQQHRPQFPPLQYVQNFAKTLIKLPRSGPSQ